MKIPQFEMERMQSTWENVVEMDMSESGVRPVTLRELAEMGLDLDAILDTPLGYSQSNGTIPLRESLAALYPGATPDHIEVTNGTSEANYLLALALLRDGDEVAFEVPNYMQYWGLPKSLGAKVNCFHLQIDCNWEPDWEEFERAVNPQTRLVYLSNPNNPSGSVLSDAGHAPHRGSLRGRGRLAAGRRGLPGRRDPLRADPQLLGHERPRDRDQRPLEGLRHPGRADRLDRRPERGRGRMLDAARLPDDRPQQDFRRRGAHGGRAAEPREALRADPRHPAAEPADDARMGRGLRRLPDVPRTAGRRAVPDALRLGHPEPARLSSACASTRAC